MAHQTCLKCHGKGHEVIARGSGLEYDYNNVCTGCGGSGYTQEYQPTLTPSNTRQKSPAPGKESVRKSAPPGSTLKTLFGIGGFLGGAVIGNQLFAENGIAILVTAFICAGIASVAYKLIIGFFLAAVILAAIFNSGDKNSTTKATHEVSPQAAAMASSAPRSSTRSEVDPATTIVTPSSTYVPMNVAPFQPSSRADAAACVEHAFEHYVSLISPAQQLRRKLSDQEKVAVLEGAHNSFARYDVSKCPQDFQASHQAFSSALGSYADANRRRSAVGGGVSWLGGVTDEQYEVIRSKWSAEGKSYTEAAVLYVSAERLHEILMHYKENPSEVW